jgi:glycosyltransferase involved in cell wall biosynthesis
VEIDTMADVVADRTPADPGDLPGRALVGVTSHEAHGDSMTFQGVASGSTTAATAQRAPHCLFLGRLYAGHRTRFLNLRAHTEHDARIKSTYRDVSGWIDGGVVERLPVVPAGVKGRLRATLEASAFATFPRPDVVWSAIGEAALPYLWAEIGPLRRPLVLDLDWTLEQQEQMAPIYYGRPARQGASLAWARLRERAFWSRVTVFTPWTTWAADSLRRQGIADARIRVLPPGVDLDAWRPPTDARALTPEKKLRLLFVGGDFERKGGHMLLDVVRAEFADSCELDVVTPDAVESGRGVRVHRAEPNSPALRALYERADLFVLPSRAECFGMATIEALASGLPCIVSDVGGARDIVEDGVTGWLIQPTAVALAQALRQALARRDTLQQMGRRARQTAEERFDGAHNDRRLVDLLIEEAERFRRGATRDLHPIPVPLQSR